jgi:hypothetical protein
MIIFISISVFALSLNFLFLYEDYLKYYIMVILFVIAYTVIITNF